MANAFAISGDCVTKHRHPSVVVVGLIVQGGENREQFVSKQNVLAAPFAHSDRELGHSRGRDRAENDITRTSFSVIRRWLFLILS